MNKIWRIFHGTYLKIKVRYHDKKIRKLEIAIEFEIDKLTAAAVKLMEHRNHG